jgi:proton glutamate symport protein
MVLNKLFRNLSFLIFLAMAIGIGVGSVMGTSAAMFAPLGTLFMQLIKMLVVPLVFISIITGAASLGATKSAGRIGLTTISYILGSTAVAVVIALIAGTWFKTGDGISLQSIQQFIPTSTTDLEAQKLNFWDILLSMIPSNPIKALTDGNVLQIIFFGLFLGLGLSMLPTQTKQPVLNGFNALLDALIWCMDKIMWVAPLGVFGLMAEATGTYGYNILLKVANLLWLNIMLFVFMILVFYPLTIKFFSRVKVTTFLKAMIRPQMVAFSTASSLATLPVTLETCEKELGVSKETASFVVPLGATVNMAGNAIYYAIVCLFFSQLYGINLGMSSYMAIIITSTLSAVGAAGVPGPTFMAVAVLASAGLPVEGLPLLFAVDRIFDMLRTVLNITGDAACAVIVDKNKN